MPETHTPSDHARAGAAPHGRVRERYDALVASGAIERDSSQIRLVQALDRLVQNLERRRRAKKGSALGWLFGRKDDDVGPPKGL